MVILRVKPRVTAMVGQRLTLGDMADVLADARLNLMDMRVCLPQGAGIWQIDTLQLVLEIETRYPNETVKVLGDETCWLQRKPKSVEMNRQGAHAKTLRVGLALACGLCVFLLAPTAVQGVLILPGICLGALLYSLAFGRGTTSPSRGGRRADPNGSGAARESQSMGRQ